MEIVRASDSSLLIVFGDEISIDLHYQVMAMFRAIRAMNDARICNLHPGYASLLIEYNPLQMSYTELSLWVRALENTPESRSGHGAGTIDIPVCYDTEFGLDLLDVASHTHMSPEEVVRIHSSTTYVVYFLGFSPGFGYFGGLPPCLHTPRLATPRVFVAAGAVGIAGSQTGIYPIGSPGGWQLIGRTPLRMFDPEATPPTRLQPGALVKFSSIDRKTYDEFAQQPSNLK
jgi:KipI family sensor histidine kinase inhibitor